MIPTAEVVSSSEPYVGEVLEAEISQKYLVSEADQLNALRAINIFPGGIQEQFRMSCNKFAHRYWIIDNSGSMVRGDGHRMLKHNGTTRIVSSTRWEELGDTILFHSEVAARMGAPTEFRLLNAAAGCPQVVQVGFGYPEQEIELMRRMAATSPVGATPLCARIREIVAIVRQREAELRSIGKRVMIIVASDGEPSDGDVEAALRPLKELPATIVVRLCTEEEKVVEFWSRVDADLEFPLDVLDDVVGEAKEVCASNPYLAYGLPLHRLREFGCTSNVIDLIDETRLSLVQVRQLVTFIYGKAAADVPHPELDWREFVRSLDALQSNDPNGTVWDPLKSRLVPWFNLHKMNRMYGKGCVLM